MPETVYSSFLYVLHKPLQVWDLKPLIVTVNPFYFLHAGSYDVYL